MKYLFIAEKPSLMREVKSCYERNKSVIQKRVGIIDFIALAGHVCADYTPDDYDQWSGMRWEDIDYPIEPAVWGVKAIAGKTDILKKIKSVIHNYNGIIVGTDSDIEGYGIYWKLEHYLQLEHIPALRFVEHSLTEKEILQSLLTMTDYHDDPVHIHATDAYLVRSRADWLFGMNCTRLMTIKKGTLLKVGRVKAATMGIVYKNSMDIAHFKPEKYYQVAAKYNGFSAVLLDENRKPAQFQKEPCVDHYPLEGVVKEVKTKRIKEHAPKLFDLTAIQAEAGRAYHYTPAETLDIVQSLYEKHKVISYPRTQCRFVSSEKAKEFPMMLSHMSAFPDLKPFLEQITEEDMMRVMTDPQVVNDKAVEQESHDALLPTSIRANPSAMTEKERNICHMIYARMLCQFLPIAEDDKTEVIIQHGSGEFLASGKQVVKQGWRSLFREAKETHLPKLEEGDQITAEKILPIQKTTKPPRRLTQATLINAMQNIANVIEDKELKRSLAESKGIGTPATRANIIQELFTGKYIEEKKDGIYITNLGITYVESLDGIDIVSPVFAARLDMKMKEVQHGEATYEEGYAYVEDELNRVCTMMKSLKQEKRNWNQKSAGSDGKRKKSTSALKCPFCGTALTELQYSYLCQEPGCGFKVSKVMCGKKITSRVLVELSKKGVTDVYDFKNRDGKPFRAKLVLTNDRKVSYEFEKAKR